MLLENHLAKYCPMIHTRDCENEFLNLLQSTPDDAMILPSFTEAYAGKRPQLIKIEDEIDKLRKLVYDKVDIKDIRAQLNNIATLFAGVFNFKRIYMSIIPSTYENAAALCSIAFMNPLSSKVKIGTNGLWDESKSLVAIVMITDAILKREDYSNAEIVAILIHEFGHQLDVSEIAMINNFQVLYNSVAKEIDSIREYQGSRYNSGWDKTLERSNAKSKPNQGELKIDQSKSSVSVDAEYGMAKDSRQIAPDSMNPVVTFLKWLFSRTRNTHRFAEQYADAVASVYGYGSELISALNKMSQREFNIIAERRKKSMFIFNIFSEIFSVIGAYREEHEASIIRAQQIINKLTNDIKTNDYPPEAKSAIMDDINKLKTLIEGSPKDPRILHRIYTACSLFLTRMSKYGVGI